MEIILPAILLRTHFYKYCIDLNSLYSEENVSARSRARFIIWVRAYLEFELLIAM